MQGSGVGRSPRHRETEYERTDENGDRLVDELERIGYRGDIPAEPQEEYEAYLELHIEQGPYRTGGQGGRRRHGRRRILLGCDHVLRRGGSLGSDPDALPQ